MDFIKNPPTVKVLAEELIRACNAYLARQITDKELSYILQGWAKSDGEKLFNGTEGYNPTIVQRVGKKRLSIIHRSLDGYQTNMMRNF